MGKVRLNENGKKLLTVIGKSPEVTMKQLVECTPYKRLSSVIRKVGQFKKCNILVGPFYDIDFGKLCKNSFSVLICVIEFDQDYETVISYLLTIAYIYGSLMKEFQSGVKLKYQYSFTLIS